MKILTSVLTMLAAGIAGATSYSWVGGTSGAWSESNNWNPSGIPGENDTLVFDSTDEITVLLGETQSMANFSVTNTPCLTFKGLASGSVVKMRQDMKTGVNAPVVFDEHAHVQFIAGKVWYVASTVKLLGGVSNTSKDAATLGIVSGSQGKYVVRGPVDFPKGVNLSAPIDMDPSSVTTNSFYTLSSGCDLQYNVAPAKETTLLRLQNGTLGFGGSAPLTIRNADSSLPSLMFNNYANPNVYLRRTMPMTIADWLALCSAANCNNNAVGFQPASGGELWITADITSANVKEYYSESPTGGFRIGFHGCGANVRMTGNNTFQGNESSMYMQYLAQGGYNSFEIDGEGATIHPFGASVVFANDGHGCFIKALSSGKTLANGFKYGNSVNNNNGYTYGFDGTNDLTVSGDFTLGTAASMLPVIGDMTLTLTGTINPGTRNLDAAGTGNVVLAPSSRVTGTTGTFGKHSAGTLTLQGSFEGSSYNKAKFCGGKTIIDYTNAATGRLNTAGSESVLADALVLRGTELVLKGGSIAETVGSANSTKYSGGLSRIRRDGGTSTIDLGTLTKDGTAALDVTSGVVKVSAASGTMLVGGITVNGDHFATVDENGMIVAAEDPASGIISGSGSSSRFVADYVVIEATGPDQSFDLGAASNPLVANKNGMIFRGDYDYSITGGYLAGANSYGDSLVFTHAGKGVLSYDGKLDRFGFTKSGPGTFRFSGTSALSMFLNLYEGTFEVASATGFSDASKTSYSVYLNGGQLKTSVDVSLVRPMSVGDNGGVIDVVADTVFTQTANITTTADGSSGPVIKKGAGTWVPSGDFQAQSKVRIEAGTVRLGGEKGIGCASDRSRAIAPTELLGGTLDIAGFNVKLGNFYLKGGTVGDSSVGRTGTLAAYTHFVEAGTVDAVLANGVCQNASPYHNSTNLKKTGPGTVTLNATNTFSGTAYVMDGTLDVAGALASGAYVSGGLLTGTGSVDGYVYVTEDGVLAPKTGATMTLGSHFAVCEGGTLRVQADATGVSKVVLASGDVYLGDDARLEFALAKGGCMRIGNGTVIVEVPEGHVVEGGFSNFPDGRYVDDNGVRYAINYNGGDGNDIVVSAYGPGMYILIR